MINEIWFVPEHRLGGALCSLCPHCLLSSTGVAEGPVPPRPCALASYIHIKRLGLGGRQLRCDHSFPTHSSIAMNPCG